MGTSAPVPRAPPSETHFAPLSFPSSLLDFMTHPCTDLYGPLSPVSIGSPIESPTGFNSPTWSQHLGLEATQVSQWKYIDTKRNPADDCSRGVSAERFLRNTRWISGPAEEDWANESVDKVKLCEEDPEVRKSATVNAIMQTCEERPTDKLLNHFSAEVEGSCCKELQGS
ncbi:hypothetical protein DPEC_G00095820 [Dallia pectoralis]|uniref:Uncharacterized protein n=1 Tax=Dallia pectoralis TaxID=75939 RepID=A0ACC2GVU8_DALPE|nr:hypothetical protein DPEC_G00095820 [Dallia pectoralis]